MGVAVWVVLYRLCEVTQNDTNKYNISAQKPPYSFFLSLSILGMTMFVLLNKCQVLCIMWLKIVNDKTLNQCKSVAWHVPHVKCYENILSHHGRFGHIDSHCKILLLSLSSFWLRFMGAGFASCCHSDALLLSLFLIFLYFLRTQA